jgi:hypothetical protein
LIDFANRGQTSAKLDRESLADLIATGGGHAKLAEMAIGRGDGGRIEPKNGLPLVRWQR